MANGLLIYKEQGFHTDQQAKIVEYVTADVIPQMVTVTLKTGKTLDVPAGKSPVAIPFVKDSPDEPKTIIKRIDASIARFPQFKTQLEIIKKDWIAKEKAVAEQRIQNAQSTSSTSDSATPENSFRDGVVATVYPDGVTVSDSSGLSKIRFSDMTPEEKARFNYDPEKEKQYIQKQNAIREAALKQQEEERLGPVHLRDVRYMYLYADELTKAYDDNEVAANRQYKGAKVRIIGVIDNIGEDIMGTPYVALKGHKMFSYVQCMFSKEQGKRLSQLDKGQKVYIVGWVSGNLMGPILRECILD